MSVQLNREHPQGKPGQMKPSEFFTLDTVSSEILNEVLNQQPTCAKFLFKTQNQIKQQPCSFPREKSSDANL